MVHCPTPRDTSSPGGMQEELAGRSHGLGRSSSVPRPFLFPCSHPTLSMSAWHLCAHDWVSPPVLRCHLPTGVLVTTASPLGLTTCSSCVTVTPPRREVPEDSDSQRGNLRPGNKGTCMWSLLWSECVARCDGKLHLKAMVLGKGLTGDQTLRSCPGHHTDL